MDVMSGLMTEILESDVYKEKGTCEELKELVDEVLPDVYVESGFCKKIILSPTNLKAMARVWSLTDVLEELPQVCFSNLEDLLCELCFVGHAGIYTVLMPQFQGTKMQYSMCFQNTMPCTCNAKER